MTRWLGMLAAISVALLLEGCGKGQAVQAGHSDAPQVIAVSTAPVSTRMVPADFQETGTFLAD